MENEEEKKEGSDSKRLNLILIAILVVILGALPKTAGDTTKL